MNADVILKKFEHPDELRMLKKGRFEIVRLGGMTIGRATYEPGWRWSEHVGRDLGEEHCRGNMWVWWSPVPPRLPSPTAG